MDRVPQQSLAEIRTTTERAACKLAHRSQSPLSRVAGHDHVLFGTCYASHDRLGEIRAFLGSPQSQKVAFGNSCY